MTVAAVLEAKRLELVVAGCQKDRVRLHVAPGVARGVLRAVDADEGAEAVVGVHAEGVRAASVAAEGDADVEADGGVGSHRAHYLVAEVLGGPQRAVAVAALLVPARRSAILGLALECVRARQAGLRRVLHDIGVLVCVCSARGEFTEGGEVIALAVGG